MRSQTLYPPLQLKVFVDDIIALWMGKNKEVAGDGEEGVGTFLRGSGEKRSQIVSY